MVSTVAPTADSETTSASNLQIRLLGTPQILLHGEPITDRLRAKAQALLFYLAVTQRPHNREVLASLLWPEASSSQGSKNLRNRLSELRKLLGDYLIITRQTIAFDLTSNYWLDTALFPKRPPHALSPRLADHESTPEQNDLRPDALAQAQEAIQHYRGDFLAGFHIGEAITFEEWATVQREQFRERALNALWALVTHHLNHTRYDDGLRYCIRMLELDAWNEEAHRTKMIMLAGSGQRNAALAHYESCRQILMDEFGVEPTLETQNIYEQIRRGDLDGIPATAQDNDGNKISVISPALEPEQSQQFGEVSPEQEEAPEPEIAQHLFDLIEMPEVEAFYGRTEELAQLDTWLVQEESRLVTILGIGGQGKTALAAEFVEKLKSGKGEKSQSGKVEKLQGGNVTDPSTLQLFNSSTLH